MASRDAIEIWLLDHLAGILGVAPDKIDLSEPFDQYGLSSRDSVGLSGELEQWLDRALPATLFYDYPSVKALSTYLSGEVAEPGPTNGDTVPPNRVDTSPIAIVGFACRFPKADSVEANWRLLMDGVDAVSETPPDRWDAEAWYDANVDTPGRMATRWGAYLENIDCFDAEFFGISPREAACMDPQQRMLLEVAWEALENSGIPPDSTAGRYVGAYVGICGSDYAAMQSRQAEFIDAYTGAGNSHSVAANRLAFFFDWKGPSFAIDAACASSLVAVHEACRALNSGECEMAIAGGVNAVLSPETSVALSRARMLAADGRCKTFDADADGYVRGEGCGLVVLKRLADAERDGDTVWASIGGSAVNHNGRSNGLTAPSGRAQQSVIRQALSRAQVRPSDICFVECQGTGTALGDAIEVGALGAVLNEGRAANSPCALGAVKTNIGHLEGAAGIAALIKAVLALRNGVIPTNLHYHTPNPDISLTGFRVPVEPLTLPQSGARVALVNGFGFGGVNAAIVLASSPQSPETPVPSAPDRHWRVMVLSAKNDDTLRRRAEQIARHLEDHPGQSLRDCCHSANTGRTHLAHRVAVVARDRHTLINALRGFAERRPHEGVVHGVAGTDRKPHVDTALLIGNAHTDDERKTMLMSLASLFVSGVAIDWQLLGKKAQRLLLPTYPFERTRHWFTDRSPRIAPPEITNSRRGNSLRWNRDQSFENRSDAVLQDLRELAASALGVNVQAIDPDFNLVALGLDSLMLMEIAAGLDQQLGFEIDRETVFLEPTLRAQAQAVARALIESPDARAPKEFAATGSSLGGWLGRIEEGRL